MEIAIGILIVIIILFVIYLTLLQRQMGNINQQLEKRLERDSRQPVSLELMNQELNRLTANINKCLKAEVTLRLESVQEEKQFKELIANISHDLRTPLTAIKGYQQLMEKGELSEDQRNKLHIARKHTHELGRLIEQFFEYSYLINAQPKINLERINVTSLVTECLTASVAAFEERGLMLQFTQAPQIFIRADKQMIMRIIQNLISNCVTHSIGEVVVVVLASLENAVISFKNPIKNDVDIDVKRMFERFYTADRARSKTTGLGLSIVKLLVEQMGGTVSADLQEKELTIQVEFPLYH